MAVEKQATATMSPEAKKRIEARKANMAAKRVMRGNRELTEREKTQLATLRNVRSYIDAAVSDIERGEGVTPQFMSAVFGVGQAFQLGPE